MKGEGQGKALKCLCICISEDSLHEPRGLLVAAVDLIVIKLFSEGLLITDMTRVGYSCGCDIMALAVCFNTSKCYQTLTRESIANSFIKNKSHHRSPSSPTSKSFS